MPARQRPASGRERGRGEIVEQGVRIGFRPHANLTWRSEPCVVNVDQFRAVEVDLDVIAAHIGAQRMPNPRCDGHPHALHLDAPAILHVVPADVVLQRVRAREVIVVLVLVAPHDTARAIHPTAHRLAPDRYAHVPERGRISHGHREAVVRPITVFLREHVGPAGGVGRGAHDPATRAPRPRPPEREAGGWLPDARAVECPDAGGLRSTRRGIHRGGRVVVVIIILVATAILAASRRPDHGEAESHERHFPKCEHVSPPFRDGGRAYDACFRSKPTTPDAAISAGSGTRLIVTMTASVTAQIRTVGKSTRARRPSTITAPAIAPVAAAVTPSTNALMRALAARRRKCGAARTVTKYTGAKTPRAATVAPTGPATKYPMNATVITTGPGVIIETATASRNCRSVSQWNCSTTPP